MNSYKERFAEAYRRTQRFGLNPPEIKFSTDTCLTPHSIENLYTIRKRTFGDPNPNFYAAKCILVHRRMKPLLEQYFASDIYLSVGYFTILEQPQFYFDETYIHHLITKGLKSAIRIHMWLTLPTMEIIDLTMCSSLVKICRSGSFIENGIIAMEADSLANKNVVYYPMLIGDDLLRRIGIINIMPN